MQFTGGGRAGSAGAGMERYPAVDRKHERIHNRNTAIRDMTAESIEGRKSGEMESPRGGAAKMAIRFSGLVFHDKQKVVLTTIHMPFPMYLTQKDVFYHQLSWHIPLRI